MTADSPPTVAPRLAMNVLRQAPATRSKAAVEHLHPRVRSHLARTEQGRRKSRLHVS